MRTRKIRALCKKLGLGTTYYQDWGHGFYDEVEADPSELEERVMSTILAKQVSWYEETLSKLARKAKLHLCPDIFSGTGLLICDGGTKDNHWAGVTAYIRIDPIPELWSLYQQHIDNGSRMPDLDLFKKHCKQLARKHWRNRDQYPHELLRPAS